MKDLNGTPLSERLGHGPVAPPETLEIARSLAEELRRLHASGVVHGALDPSCVILTGAGVSLLHREAHELTGYAAPEQVQGKAADARSDIFAFGAIVYEMLFGRKAAAGEGQEQAFPDGVAGGLGRVIHRCLAKAPEQRWQRVQNVQMELKLLGVMARREERDPESQERRWQEMLRQEIARVEKQFGAQLASVEGAASELRARLAEERERLEAANREAGVLRAEVAALTRRLETADAERQAGASTMADRLNGVDRRLAEHGSSIESLGTAVTQSDDLIEHLVDELDAIERSVAGRDKNQTVVAALSL
jgi:hypothetical protein